MSSHSPVDSLEADTTVARAARILALEALALRVTAALESRDVAVLLLKGPVTNRWLYGDAVSREFGDVDLLVAPAPTPAAEAVLHELGFRNNDATVLGIFRPDYESSWTSAGAGPLTCTPA